MRFKEYFDQICHANDVTSIRKAADFFEIGKSGIERIKAGECDIPTEKMLSRVATVAGDSIDQVYEELDYVPIYNNYAINKRIKEILDYRDTHFEDGAEVLPTVVAWFINYYKKMPHKTFNAYGGMDLSVSGSPAAVPDFYFELDDKLIAFEFLRHRTSGNVILSSNDNFKEHLSRMLSIEGISEYILICMNDKEGEYLRTSNDYRVINTTVKIRIAFYVKDMKGFMPLRLIQDPYREPPIPFHKMNPGN